MFIVVPTYKVDAQRLKPSEHTLIGLRCPEDKLEVFIAILRFNGYVNLTISQEADPDA